MTTITVDTSVLADARNTTTAVRASPATETRIPNDFDTPTENGDTFNIVIGGGDFSLEELRAAGIPVYVFSDLSPEQVAEIANAVWLLNNTNPSPTIVNTSVEYIEPYYYDEDDEDYLAAAYADGAYGDTAGRSSPNMLVPIFGGLAIFAVVGFFVTKSLAKKRSREDGDLYEGAQNWQDNIFLDSFKEELMSE